MLPPSHRLLTPLLLATLSASVATSTGCVSDFGESLAVDCGGKCDGFDDIKALLRDPSELDLDDLVRIGAPFATDQINDALTLGSYAQFRLGDTKAFTSDELNQLVTGLAARFGESELSTTVNRLRRDHLAASNDTVYGESTFALRSNLSKGFNIDTGTEAGSINLGFSAGGEIAVHMVAAYDDDIDAILNAPLATIKQTGRGFVLPRDTDDIVDMKPGESIGMRSEGRLGINVGVGVPILIAEPVSSITYNFVISAGLRNQLEGELDVQMVRLGGKEVLIDVGIEKARVKSSSIALTDSWGVQGLLEANVSIAGINVDLGRLVEKALEKQLNKQLDLVEARATQTSRDMRMSVARLRFDLAQETDEMKAAIAQALRGDVRLAQALANREEPGVSAEFDLSRSGISATSYAGLQIAGMEFFRSEIEQSGTVVVQTPGGARSILFDSLHRSSGFFLSRHGYTRVAMSSVGFDANGDAKPTGEANLVVQIDEGDKAMERDKFVDYLDSMIVSVAGIGTLEALEDAGNRIEDLVETECAGTKVFDECPVRMVADSRVVALKTKAMEDFDRAAGHVGGDVGAVIRRAAELRILAQSVYEQKAQFTGPGVSATVDYRLDEAALKALMAHGAGGRIKSAITNIIKATEVDRRSALSGQRSSLASAMSGELASIETMVDGHAATYRKLLNIEAAAIERLGGIGARAIEVRFQVDSNNRADYESAAANTITARRAEVASDMFGDLRDAAGGFGPHKEQVAGFAILGATDAKSTDIRFDLDVNLDDGFAFWREPYREANYPTAVDVYGKGEAVSRIDGGLFSVDQLIKLEN